MLPKTLPLLLPALAAAAQIHPRLHALQPRQTASPETSACLADIEAAGSSFPALPQELVGLTDIKPITDPCDYTPPATMATAFSSYQTVVLSWVSENWPKVTSAAEKCPQLSSNVEGFSNAWELLVCTDKSGGGGATATTPGVVEATPTGGVGGGAETGSGAPVPTGTAATAGAQSTTKSAGGARETGFVAGVVAVVGFVGAVVAL